jgi:hypothetical protein
MLAFATSLPVVKSMMWTPSPAPMYTYLPSLEMYALEPEKLMRAGGSLMRPLPKHCLKSTWKP